MAVATIRIPGLNYRPRNPTLVRYRSSAGSSSQTSFLRTFFPGNHRFERRRQFELPREKRRLVLVDAKISKADDAARDRRNLQKRHDGWRGESAKKKSSTASTTASASSPPKEVPADSSPPAVVSSPADSGTSEPAATGSVTAAAPEPADTSVPDTVPANASGTETALATEPDASTAAAAAAAADTATDTATAAEPVLIAPPEDVPPSEAALPRTAIATESPFPALSAAAQESLSRAQRASSGAWQSLATAAAEPVTLPKQLQESVQALPLPPSLTRRLGVADGSAVLLTRGQLAAALLAVGLLVKGIQSWLKARATALNNEYAVPAPLLPASPNFPTIPDLPPVVPTKRTPEELPNLPVSSPPRQLPERAIAPVPVPVMASAYVATASASSSSSAAAAATSSAAVAAVSLPSAAVAPSSAAAAAAAKEACAPLPAALIESEPPFETFTNPDNTGSRAESREEEKTLLPPAFFKFTDSLPPLPFPFKNWSSFGKASGVSPIDMDEIDRMAAAAASKGDVSDSEIDDRPRLIKLQQDNAMAWFALITGFLVLVAYAWNPANPLNP